ncbi:DNA-directed RNA polymerase subunit alpha [Metamycoplasma hyosynoviae]|uniref:DNA-directed RNA polymerase subunit alpha n=3 Tax=Metamycoplasma hyosynoviae TaxID=29559 RepID=A0A063Y6J0_9BACT|nr:DNA-directed RNA polymerase subunit alpha [Metamycoplasma hyosynoviae]ASI53930.1 DNA-directed RNA polymerase subunit alpha [Metamycoplasma hyosynoviae]KDE41946.1 DNA-directed RNA polymerase subunit alpha [Metamycoplasma hyosynoviae]KDE41993.1 DNA-directed RNA polymerase subunit alpha [Metamycoplasma hyosynoviae]KDE43238.1 DNA-directed RNA polymerase subunit alpha [Metamycoplasma hyosynoviae]KDE43354.1 DNA-directed RNA polymerase subunit alpha [Metamycoplasma hyosynoviae]
MEKFEKIKYQELKSEHKSEFETVFSVEPLVRGYGITLGTVLRRTLLSSITSIAPFAIKIDGIEHEFQTLKGVQEDVVNLISNIRAIKFTYVPKLFEKDNLVKISFKSTHTGEIYANDITNTNGLEIVNKDAYICTIAQDGHLEFDLFLRTGRGFIDFEENKNIIQQYGPKLDSKIKIGQYLAIDSDFSPVEKVAITVEQLNTGSIIENEKLKIAVKTYGTLTSAMAMEQAAKIIVAHFQIIGNFDALETVNIFEVIPKEKEKVVTSSVPIEKLNLTIRSLNALRRAEYSTVDELAKLTEEELGNIKNLGKKSIDDIIEKLKKWRESQEEKTSEEIDK